MAAKGKIPPGFRKAAKKITAEGPARGERVVDPQGRIGTVKSAAAGMVKVEHDQGGFDYHPAGSVRKLAEFTSGPRPPAPPAPKKKARKR